MPNSDVCQYTDPETGLIYLRARYYDPTTGQFLTPDPLFAVTGERYVYVGNDPINSDDPNGLFHIPGTDYCVDIADSKCHSRADGKSLKDTKANFMKDRGTLATILATGLCFLPAVGWVACGAMQAVAAGVRAQQRASEHGGLKCTWHEDVADIAITAMFWGVGSSPEAFDAFNGESTLYQNGVKSLAGAPGATHDLSTLNRDSLSSCSCR